MGGADQPVIVEALRLVWGSIVLRPYVFGFLGVYLAAATAAWGWRRAVAFTLWAGGLAFVAEWSSTRVGVPFGLYHYTGETAGRELYLSNVPFFDSLSFTFLAYASLGLAGQLLGRGRGGAAGRRRRRAPRGLDRLLDAVARRRDRSPGGAGRSLVPRPDLLLPGARVVLRGSDRQLRGLGGRRRGDRLGLGCARAADPPGAARLGPPPSRAPVPRAQSSTTSSSSSTSR